MEFKFNVTGQERKSLVGAISEILNTPTHYNGAPTFSYTVGEYHIDKEGTVTGEWDLRLMVGLESRGFEYEPSKTFHLITPRGTLLIQKQFLTAEDAQAEGYDMYFSHQGRGIFTKPSGTSEHGKYFAVVGEPFKQEEPAEEPTPEIAPDNCDGEAAPDSAEVTDISTDKDGGIDTITIEFPKESRRGGSFFIPEKTAEEYKRIFGFYPKVIIGDRAYAIIPNREFCKARGIRLSAPKRGRKSLEVKEAERKQLYRQLYAKCN
jgi:hypothetical protein